VNEVIDKGQWAGELRHTTSSGKELVAESRWALRRGEDGKPTGFLEVNRDITARKQAEDALKGYAEKLKLLNQQLQTSNRELEEFAFVTSHDLQEPLRKIQAFGGRLRLESAGCLNEKSLDFLGRMEKSASRMQTLIRTILDYSRIAICHRPFSPVALNSVLVEVQNCVSEQLTRASGKIAVDSLPAIEADRVQMEQLFENLVSNALKYQRPDVPPLVRVYANSAVGAGEDGMCSICVEDNGIGFDERFVNKIFAPFQRLHGRKEYEGTGIGLAICRRIVERHNGTIVAKSTPGRGSIFIVTLPARHKGAEYREFTENCREIRQHHDMREIEEEKP
jgi:light-regulated signal transduction histidine kinase (bacteriophytochrome)